MHSGKSTSELTRRSTLGEERRDSFLSGRVVPIGKPARGWNLHCMKTRQGIGLGPLYDKHEDWVLDPLPGTITFPNSHKRKASAS